MTILLCICSVTLRAQTRTVGGTVKDVSGNPIVGAVVMLDGNQKVASVADIDGKWTLTLPAGTKDNANITVSCLSFAEKTVQIGKNTVINVVLEEDSEMLEETVVVGYGSMRRSDLTGSVTSVKINEDDAAKSGSLDQLLMGHAAGVEVITASESPDAGVSIRIRGITSLNGSSEPLYVIDGVILTDANSGSSGLGKVDESEEVNSLMGLNPQDIASIEVLKDASATAIYGSAGANGVVLITTKVAQKDKPVVQFNVGYDVNTPLKYIDVLSFDGYVDYLKYRVAASDGGWGQSGLNRIYSDYGTEAQALKVRPVSWQHEYIGNSERQRYYLSVSGRPKTLSYKLSLGYNKATGVVSNTGSETITARLNADKRFGKKFTIGTKFNFSTITSQAMQNAGSGDNGVSSSFMKSMTNYRPYIRPGEEEDVTDIAEEALSSPMRWITDTKQVREELRITPSIYMQYKVLPWLTLKSSFGADYRWQERTKYKGPTVYRSPASGVSAQTEIYSWNWDNLVTMSKSFGKHNLTGTLGFTMSRWHNSAHTLASSHLLQYGTGFAGIASGDTIEYTFTESDKSQMSTFVRLLYSYGDRYVLTATYRLDGSSVFAQRNRFAGFPSAAFAWRINKEPWFHVRAISNLKLRVGYGEVGNCSVSPYQVMSQYGAGYLGNHFNESGYKPALSFANFANETLKWESTRQVNLGLDLSLFRGRITLTADAYYKDTHDLLQKRYVTYNTGVSSVWANKGSIINKGLEFTLEAVPVAEKNVEWTLFGNISFNRNTLSDIGFDVEEKTFYFEPGVPTQRFFYAGQHVATSQYLASAPINIFMLGQPIGLFYGYRTDGMIREGEYGVPISQANYKAGKYPGPGSIKYVDMNGDGYIDANDKTIIGDANPDFTYGFSTALTLWKFRLSLNFQGSFGAEIFNANRMALSYGIHAQSSPRNVYKDAFYNAWTIVNPYSKYAATYDAIGYGIPFEDVITTTEFSYASDRDVEDASYFRLSSANLSYSFDLPKNSPLSRIVAGFSVGNVFVLTKYSGFSPTVNSYKISSQRIGIDSGGYPMSRSYCFDLKFTF